MASDLTFTQGDTSPSVFGFLTNDDGTAFDLTNASVRFQMTSTLDRRFTVNSPASIVGSAALGAVRYDWAAGDLATVGDYTSKWKITFLDGGIEHTRPGNTITVERQ